MVAERQLVCQNVGQVGAVTFKPGIASTSAAQRVFCPIHEIRRRLRINTPNSHLRLQKVT